MDVNFKNKRDIQEKLSLVRRKIERAFGEDTALPGTKFVSPSSGHCAVVAVILNRLYGGELVSTRINEESHWYNRFHVGEHQYDVDLTGDQFEFDPIQITETLPLYPESKIRVLSEVNHETLKRATKLAKKAGLNKTCLISDQL